MNAYHPLESTRRLQNSGLGRSEAEAIATEINDGTRELVTKEQLDAALDRLTIRLSVIMGGIVTLACSILGVVLSH